MSGSDLRYKSVPELRREIDSSVKRRQVLLDDAGRMESEAALLTAKAAAMRKKSHDLGQREAWARIYLARKEIETC